MKTKESTSQTHLLSMETLDVLVDLGRVLERIHDRMENDGFTLIDGKICKKPDTV